MATRLRSKKCMDMELAIHEVVPLQKRVVNDDPGPFLERVDAQSLYSIVAEDRC